MNVNGKNYKSFEQLSMDIRTLKESWKNASADKDRKRTFAGIQQEMQNLYFFLTNERANLDAELDKLKDVWSNKVIAERREKLIGEFNEMVKGAVKAIRQDIETLTSTKMDKIGDMLATAPSEEQLRLLSALQMRKDIDYTEIIHILPVFFENYQAMKVLSAIGERNGVALELPSQLDCRTMFDMLNEATDYLLRACDELPKEWKDLSITYHAFFTVNPKEKGKQYDPRYQQYIDLFDYTPQLQDCKAEKQYLSQDEKAKIDWYFRDIATLNPSDAGDHAIILHRVEEVLAAHPEEKDLLKLSQYADYVAEVETIKKDEPAE